MDLKTAFQKVCDFCREYPSVKGGLSTGDPKVREAIRHIRIISQWLNQRFSRFNDARIKIVTSEGAGSFPRVPWICLLPPGQSVNDGIHVGICFGKAGNGAVVGCMESASAPKGLATVKRATPEKAPVIDVDGIRPGTRYNNVFANPLEVFRDNFDAEVFAAHISESLRLALAKGDPGKLEKADGAAATVSPTSPTGPRFIRLIGAVLDALRSMGGTGTPKAVADWIVEQKLVTEAEQAEKMSSGASRFKNHVDWARFYLAKAGLISSAKRGIWALTPAGENTHPSMSDALELFQLVQAMMEEETPEGNTELELHENDPESAPVKRRYWWLNANPKIWDFRTAPIGSVQTYTSHNEDGNKRQKYKYFAAVQVGDLLLGYVTTPDKEIVAVCEVTKALHGPPGREAIEFRKVEQFQEPLTWAELQSVPALADCEPLVSNQGSLFAVKEEEYDTIRAIIDERNLSIQPSASIRFTKADALSGLFMTESELDTILARLRRKKALILQGPPGVGKTFIARRLAFALMGERDERRVAMVQFHPSYGYEDFVQGYRPTRTGLERRDAVFYQFARLARNDPKRDWFFIIDEINRGNLAKIFGELLMLIEADKRGSEHAIPLTYSENADETFHLPANLHVIGTMNTADRSLAMVDYALRRRFAFVTLSPALDSQAFGEWLTERKAPDAVLARIRERIGALNAIIEKERDLGAGFRIGHSFFCPSDGRAPDEAWYQEIVVSEIQPLLEEYFDSRERVEKLIADLLD